MRSSSAFPGCPSKGRPLLANAKHAGRYFRIRISFTLPQHGEVPERSNGEPLSLSGGGERGFESVFLQRRVSCEPVFLVKDPEHLQILESAGHDRPDPASELEIDPP